MIYLAAPDNPDCLVNLLANFQRQSGGKSKSKLPDLNLNKSIFQRPFISTFPNKGLMALST